MTNQYKYSITFRPQYEIFTKIEKPLTYFSKKFDKICEKYIISLEKGKGEDYNHLQIYIELNENNLINQKALRKQLVRFIKDLNIDKGHLKIALKVKEIKSNFEGVIGYTLKEDGDKNIKGFNNNDIKTYKKLYLEHQSNKETDNSFYRLSKKNYHIYVKSWIENNPIKFKSYMFSEKNITQYINQEEKEEITVEVIKRVIDNMIIDKYYFTFLNSRNIKDIVNYLYFFLNGKEGYVDYLYDQTILEN